ncbi:retrovirus-related pol polyprotein from transposon TNT 1-94 [Tanacetum coccineum]
MNVNGKSKSVKAKSGRKNKKEWKPTGEIFSSVGHRWLPTGRKFTMVGKVCPLTRMTSINVVPLKTNVSPNPNTNVPKPKVKVFHRSAKVAKAVRLNANPSILGPKPSNIKEPNQTWGSKSAISPSFSLVNSRTDNGIEFVNQTLRAYHEDVGISHETSVARSPQQNGIVERPNQTLVEVVHTMLIFSKALLFLWVEAVVTACYTQN